jgi:hypothetical protein
MAASTIDLLSDPALHQQVAIAARDRVRHLFCVDYVVPMYERYYERILTRAG